MGNPYVGNAATFLISTLFSFYILLVLLRMLLGWVRADFYNPISQFLVKATNPPLIPLRRFIPGYGGVDLAAVVLLIALQALELLLIAWVVGQSVNLLGLLVWSVAELLSLTVYVFIFSIIIEVILSWVSPGTYHPVAVLLYRLNAPLLAPARRLIPPISGVDLSPLVAIIVLQLASMLLVAPLRDLGQGLALG